MKTSIIATAMSTATKIDENNLRRGTADKLGDLLEMARRKQTELMAVVAPAIEEP
jgi:hypothetical protein